VASFLLYFNMSSYLCVSTAVSIPPDAKAELGPGETMKCHRHGPCQICPDKEKHEPYCLTTGRRALVRCEIYKIEDTQPTTDSVNATSNNTSSSSPSDASSTPSPSSAPSPNSPSSPSVWLRPHQKPLRYTDSYESCDMLAPGASNSFWAFEGFCFLTLVASSVVLVRRNRMVENVHNRRIMRMVNS